MDAEELDGLSLVMADFYREAKGPT